ncbi:MAG: thioredoxin domain-containing protein [Planctomycetes bacterium]|nr:thioredoxin domain-containing protein [Planctomycetota bacterium]
MTNPAHTNRLAKEFSPYLLQHQHNPVDWYPWGAEAFDKAKREDKLVFLSVGYATCHWCHVMEHESFESEEIAALLNKDYVAIKVDREERPDIDNVYMQVVQAFTSGHGGWPMSVFLAPDQRPVFAATYLPPANRFGRPGFGHVLSELARLWKSDRDNLLKSATEVTTWLNERGAPQGRAELGKAHINVFARQLESIFDSDRGGFGNAPKFPRPHSLSLLLRHYRDHKEPQVLGMVEKTLECMDRGGMNDQIGGGFHRYSTDENWLLPHFEKMLYDQALMTNAYLEAWQVTGKPQYAATVRNICDYVLRDLRDEKGGFHSAEDADSEGVEGKFYVWSMAELKQVLGADAALFAEVYGCGEKGNFHDEATHKQSGENILHLPAQLEVLAFKNNMREEELSAKLRPLREKLLAVRSKRVRPLLDDKVLADWNGLMIGAIARTGAALNEARYLKAAQEAADFILTTMQKDARLLHRYRKGNAGILGYLEDYTFLANGLIDLYQCDFNARWLSEAQRLCREAVRLFRVEKENLFHTQGSDDPERLIAPSRVTYDGAIPSGNAAAALALVRIGRLCQDEKLVEIAKATLDAYSTEIESRPEAYPYALMALDWLVNPTQEIVVAGKRAESKSLLDVLARKFLPRAVVALHEPGDAEIEKLIPAIKAQVEVGGEAAAYVCTNFACRAPVTEAAALERAL